MRMSAHIHPHIFREEIPPPNLKSVWALRLSKLFCCSEQSRSEVTSPLCSLQHKPFVSSAFIMNITSTTAAQRQS